MKTILVSMCMLCILSASAQTKKKSTTQKQANKAVAKQNFKKNSNSKKTTSAASYLSATSSYSAKSLPSVSTTNQYAIADPTLKALSARANGADIKISNSGIVGMPKRAYGFANGKLTLYSSGGTSSGTITGSGSVGSGSSLGSIGSHGPAIGLNGKSPHAGSAMWGNATGLVVSEKKEK